LSLAGASVRIAAELRPEHAAHVRVASFDGPLALLLALIEQRQLDVLEVPLGELAAAYLDALAELPQDQLPHISAFVAVASQLILIKSRALLPRPPAEASLTSDEGPSPEEALRARLIEYRRFRDAAALLATRLGAGAALFHREPAVAAAAGKAGARPPAEPPLDPRLLVDALTASTALAPPPPPPPEVMPRTVTIDERVGAIRAALRSAPRIVLQEVLAGVRDRTVIAVTFLAMLELAKARELTITQDEPWGPIHCQRSDPASRLVAIPVGEPASDGSNPATLRDVPDSRAAGAEGAPEQEIAPVGAEA
jgi:segregation and condensation protein A